MKGSQPQTVSTMPDPATQGYVTGQGAGGLTPQQVQILRNFGANPSAGAMGGSGYPGFGGLRNFAINAASQPLTINPALTGAVSSLGQYSQAGQQGLAAQTDPAAAAKFMNPYLSAMDPTFDKLRQQSLQASNSQATGAGAFGGSRNAVTNGVALSNIANQQAGFNYQGFQDAMQRALQSANLGLGATSLQGGLGQYLTNLPMQYRQQQLALLQGGIGPYGQTQQTQTQSDPFSSLLGIGSFFLPGGPLAGLFKSGAGALDLSQVP